MRVVVTGATGNIGLKLCTSLIAEGTHHVTGIDMRPGDGQVQVVQGDLSVFDAQAEWVRTIQESDAVIHLAACNPYPTATWQDAAVSMDLTANVIQAASKADKKIRVVFASSNHMFGGLKEDGVTLSDSAKRINGDTEPSLGTKLELPGMSVDSTAYATAKLMGERLGKASVMAGDIEFVSIRIGWCQPGDNNATTLSVSGDPNVKISTSDQSYSDKDTKSNPTLVQRWFRLMWLSNRDMIDVFKKSLHADLSKQIIPGYFLAMGMSNNKDMRWDIEPTKRVLGYDPQDDVSQHVEV